MKKVVVTGAAGFIGSNLVDDLLVRGLDVLGLDNFSSGNVKFLESAKEHPNFNIISCDLLDQSSVEKYLDGSDFVFHFAANADVRFGTKHPSKDLEQNTIATFNVLEAMRKNSIQNIVFASSAVMYGEAQIIPTPEDGPMPIQTSLYGASKLACEAMIEAYCEGFNFKSWIFRFVSILGQRYTHGHVYDFCKQLKKDPSHLYILGDGNQKKAYLHVDDFIDGIWVGINNSNDKINIFNLGAKDFCPVSDSAQWIIERLKLSPKITYSGGERGWVGDNPFIFLETNKISSFGWEPINTIRESIEKTVDFLLENEWVFDFRK